MRPRLAAALVVAIGLAALPPAGAQSRSRIVDRTLSCATQPSGGIYEIEARGHAGTRDADGRWFRLPFGVVATGRVVGNTGRSFLDDSLAWITAGRPTAATTIGQEIEISAVLANGTLALNRTQCRTVSTPVPLSSAGLNGSAAGQLGESLDCRSPRRVLVRVRAVLQSADALRIREGFYRTTTPVLDAKLAVRTLTGKPLVFSRVLASGRATLYTAPNCTVD